MPAAKVPYRVKDLLRRGAPKRYRGSGLAQIAFPLGGIGTGNVALGGRGELRDWEIWGRPSKGTVLPMTFFALWAREAGRAPVAKILERRLLPPYAGHSGVPRDTLGGVARMDEAVFRGAYPFAHVEFADTEVPVAASLEAFTPFVPLDAEASSYPVAVFHWTFRNRTKKAIDLALLASMQNPCGHLPLEGAEAPALVRNQYRSDETLHGVWFTVPEAKDGGPNAMSAALATSWRDADVQTHLYKGGWWDAAHLLWDDFAGDGRLAPRIRDRFDVSESGDPAKAPGTFARPKGHSAEAVGALALHARLKPGETVTLPVLIAWHAPYVEIWDAAPAKSYMAKQFADAWDAASKLERGKQRLTELSRRYEKSFYGSTLPSVALDAAGSQASILRTTTCLRTADGQFYGWEGCFDKGGCCKGTCTHVWNYEQALAFLFPELERSIRRHELLDSTDARGDMAFRCGVGDADAHANWKHAPAADGQMGCLIRLYRDWQFCGDDSFLREVWPAAKRALEYAWTQPNGWDADRDGVMEGCQHNTYDIEFYGPNPLMGVLYLGALEAGARMAQHLGEAASADEYRALAAKGRKRLERELWNGAYFIQRVNVAPGLTVPPKLRGPLAFGGGAPDCGPGCDCGDASKRDAAPGGVPGKDFEVKYQHGAGCLSDQLLGQFLCHVSGLGHVIDAKKSARGVRSIFENNFRKPIGGFSNVQRIYALNDEAGLLLCSWPKGNRPRLPFVYSDEVWTGIEYQVAAHLVYEGFLAEGLAVAKAVRDRHDGARRNPWDEFECGHHYARAMAAWGLVTALSGFDFSAVDKRIGFAPRVSEEDFRCFFSTGGGWGTYAQRVRGKGFAAALKLDFGRLALREWTLPPKPAKKAAWRVTLDGKGVPSAFEGGVLRFEKEIAVEEGQMLRAESGR